MTRMFADERPLFIQRPYIIIGLYPHLASSAILRHFFTSLAATSASCSGKKGRKVKNKERRTCYGRGGVVASEHTCTGRTVCEKALRTYAGRGRTDTVAQRKRACKVWLYYSLRRVHSELATVARLHTSVSWDLRSLETILPKFVACRISTVMGADDNRDKVIRHLA